MNDHNLDKMSVQELVELFAKIGVAQGEAIEESVIPPDDPSYQIAQDKFEKLFREMASIDRELCRRGKTARLALTQLYEHPDMQVKLKAAIHTLGVAPKEARQVLQWIRDSGWPNQSLDAGMTIRNLDDGTFKPN